MSARLLSVAPAGGGMLIGLGVNQHDAELLTYAGRHGALSLALLADGATVTPDDGVRSFN